MCQGKTRTGNACRKQKFKSPPPCRRPEVIFWRNYLRCSGLQPLPPPHRRLLQQAGRPCPELTQRKNLQILPAWALQ